MKGFVRNLQSEDMHFHPREGFEIMSEDEDEATGEKEYLMTWQLGL